MIRRQLVGGFAIALTLVASARLHADAIVGSLQESFDYADGTQFPNPSTLNGGSGWNLLGQGVPGDNDAGAVWGTFQNGGAAAGTYRTATSPGLTYTATGYLPASGNKLTLDAAASAAAGTNVNQNIGRSFGGQVIDAGTTYFSYLTSKNNDTERSINFAFFDSTLATPAERFAIGQISGNAAVNQTNGNFSLLMNNQNPNGLIKNETAPIAYGVGVTHLIVGRIDWNDSGNETVSIWIDPADVTTEAAAGSVYLTTSDFELTRISGIRPFVGNTATPTGFNFPAASANFDEFRIGGTWASVTSEPVAIPEPASAALGGLAVLALAGLRRKRR